MVAAGRSGPRGRTVVFLGPTMAVDDAARVLDAVYLPPAAQGSLVCAVTMLNPARVVLIDGVFGGEPAVRHKEILWTLSRGMAVYGASSMGALRAAELDRHGMIGVGLVYRWYRRFQCLPDDAVAVLHGPPELGSRPLTVSLIDLRLTIRNAFRKGLIDLRLRDALDRAARALNFRERTPEAVALEAARTGLATGTGGPERVAARLRAHPVAQKRADAVAALERVRTLNKDDRPGRGTGSFTMTRAFRRDIEDAGLSALLPRLQETAGAPRNASVDR